MLSTEFETLRCKLIKCYKYRDLESAIYMSIYLSQHNADYCILTVILLFENRECARALQYLRNMHGTTAQYYKALCYKNTKKYKEAIEALNIILDGRSQPEKSADQFVSGFILDNKDTEFFDSLYGELMILRGKCKVGIEKYKKSTIKNPLLGPCFGLFDENTCISTIGEFSKDPFMILFQDLFKISIQRKKSVESDVIELSSKKNDNNPSIIIEFFAEFPEMKHYFTLIPGIGSYFVCKIAAMYCKQTQSKVGLQMFEILREHDPAFVREMDVYSTTLWINKDLNLLGLLAKDLISTTPNSHITWSVIANYYSLNGMQKESATCLMKSLNIQENPSAYCLLGFEYNIRNQYLDAQNYFKSSLCMLENNDRAYFGLGIVYGETSRKQAAEIYFNKALELNPRNTSMKAFLVRFYAKNDEHHKALIKIKEFLQLDCQTSEQIVEKVQKGIGKFTEIEELMICELVEILLKSKSRKLAEKVLQCVQIRTSTYFTKKSMIENEN
ncbi:anaphase-promoting complex subunit cdc27 [Glugoides intestinalis]